MIKYMAMHPSITRMENRKKGGYTLYTNIPDMQSHNRFIIANENLNGDGYVFTDGGHLSETLFLLSPKEAFPKLFDERDKIDRYASMLPHVETKWNGMGVVLTSTACNIEDCFDAIEQLLSIMAIMDGIISFTQTDLL